MENEQEIKQLLRENLEVSQENLRILKKLNGARIRAGIYSFLKFAVFVAITLGSYYYIEPYLTKMLEVMNSAVSTLNQVKKTGEAVPKNLQDLQKNITPDFLKSIQEMLQTRN